MEQLHRCATPAGLAYSYQTRLHLDNAEVKHRGQKTAGGCADTAYQRSNAGYPTGEPDLTELRD